VTVVLVALWFALCLASLPVGRRLDLLSSAYHEVDGLVVLMFLVAGPLMLAAFGLAVALLWLIDLGARPLHAGLSRLIRLGARR